MTTIFGRDSSSSTSSEGDGQEDPDDQTQLLDGGLLPMSKFSFTLEFLTQLFLIFQLTLRKL